MPQDHRIDDDAEHREKRPSVMRGLTRACGWAMGAFLSLCLLGAVGIVAGQRLIVYPIAYLHDRSAPFLPLGWKEIGTPHAGLDLRSYVFEADSEDAPVLIVLHGNAADPFSMTSTASPWTRAGWTVIVPEFPGYADSPGSPTEAGIRAAALGSWDWATRHGASPSRIVVLGNSIGSGAAISLAAGRKPAMLMIVSGMASLGDVIRNQVPFVPDALVWDLWSNVPDMRRVRSKVMVWHGTKDTLVPHSQGALLAKAANVALRDRDAGHELFWDSGLQDEMLATAGRVVGEAETADKSDAAHRL
jgi:dienelactone hydrolase